MQATNLLAMLLDHGTHLQYRAEVQLPGHRANQGCSAMQGLQKHIGMVAPPGCWCCAAKCRQADGRSALPAEGATRTSMGQGNQQPPQMDEVGLHRVGCKQRCTTAGTPSTYHIANADHAQVLVTVHLQSPREQQLTRSAQCQRGYDPVVSWRTQQQSTHIYSWPDTLLAPANYNLTRKTTCANPLQSCQSWQ